MEGDWQQDDIHSFYCFNPGNCHLITIHDFKMAVLAYDHDFNMFTNIKLLHSDVNRLFRVMAYMLLFIRRLQKTDQSPSIVTTELFNRAEIQIAQSTLREEPHYESWKNQLEFFTGLLRCKGRLKNTYTTQFPLILPRNHLTILLVRQAHEVFHNGVKETPTQL